MTKLNVFFFPEDGAASKKATVSVQHAFLCDFLPLFSKISNNSPMFVLRLQKNTVGLV